MVNNCRKVTGAAHATMVQVNGSGFPWLAGTDLPNGGAFEGHDHVWYKAQIHGAGELLAISVRSNLAPEQFINPAAYALIRPERGNRYATFSDRK
jgi:hypothetical protein|tara:strand:- start:219 stop:503 length:285 start_codon:yes stop_codon:yes gene_type:complete